MLAGWRQRDFLDVPCEERARLGNVRIYDGSNLTHVKLDKTANVAEFDAQGIWARLQQLRGYPADLALAVHESRPESATGNPSFVWLASPLAVGTFGTLKPFTCFRHFENLITYSSFLRERFAFVK